MKIHFTGILGQGMTALAEILKARGTDVIGSDTMTESFTTNTVLKQAGIAVLPFTVANITDDIEKVIFSTAYRPDRHDELKEAKRRGIPLRAYGEALAELFNSFPHRVLITGTHGKSTTSAMVGFILEQAGYDPTVIVGGEALNWKRNSRAGKSDWIVAEGDEYQAKIRALKPTVLVLTPIDYDHPDFFKTKKIYQNLFKKVAARVPNKYLVSSFFPLSAKQGNRISCRGMKLPYLFGTHNEENARLACRTAQTIGISERIVHRALRDFRGVARRLEYHSDPKANMVLLEDYAHHPTEIRAALDAVRARYPRHQIIAVFQPHTFSRTKAFLNDFVCSFQKADVVVILKTYGSARENKRSAHGADAKTLSKKIALCHPRAFFARTHQEAAKIALRNFSSPGVILIMGAGDVNRVLSLCAR